MQEHAIRVGYHVRTIHTMLSYPLLLVAQPQGLCSVAPVGSGPMQTGPSMAYRGLRPQSQLRPQLSGPRALGAVTRYQELELGTSDLVAAGGVWGA